MWIFICLTLVFFSEARAQDLLSAFDASKFSTRIELENLSTANADVENGEQDTAVDQRQAAVQTSILQDEKQFVTVGGRWQNLDFSENQQGLRDYHNIQGSVVYRRFLPENRFWSMNVNYGSASDRPFKNGRDGTIGATYLHKTSARWMLLVNYSNNRTFLNNVPLPGFVYLHSMSRESTLILGFPFAYWVTPVGKKLSFRYFGLLPWSHKAKLVWVNEKHEPYLGFEQSLQSFFDTRREEKTDRTFWFERKFMLGLEGKFLKNLSYDVQSGLAFDRTLFEARNYSEEKNYLTNFANGLYVAFNLKLSF